MASAPVMGRLVARSIARNFPLNVHFDVTYRCNERCVHCYLDHSDHGEMTTGEIKRVLAELAEAGTLFLTFSGGEIFLRHDFFELLAHARKLRFDVTLKTNALLITEERAALLKQLGVRRIQISLYSADAAIHDAITKVPGSFERTLEALRFCQVQGLLVKISCPLMKQNIGAWREVRALADALGVTYIMDPTITPMMDGSRDTLAMRLAPSELLPVLKDPIFNPPAAAPVKTEGADMAVAYDNIPCSAGHNSLYISPYGDVYPCVQMPLATGNLREKSFTEIWYGSAKMQRVRDIKESELAICRSCAIRNHCQRCPGLAFMEDGGLTGPSARACELAEAAARIAGVANPVSGLRARGRLRTTSNSNPAQLVHIAALGVS
ncbi:MAG: radical SAM protein [Acidobacteria bacterium]|nr:radical SAM protein [Acidobacteriota bacterium]